MYILSRPFILCQKNPQFTGFWKCSCFYGKFRPSIVDKNFTNQELKIVAQNHDVNATINNVFKRKEKKELKRIDMRILENEMLKN